MFDFEALFKEVAEAAGAQLVDLTAEKEHLNYCLTATYRKDEIDIIQAVDDWFFIGKSHYQAKILLAEDALKRYKWALEQKFGSILKQDRDLPDKFFKE